MSNVLQTFLHLWDYLHEFSVAILVHGSYLHGSVYFSTFQNQNIFEQYTEMSNLLTENHLMLRTTWY